jgi:uncharacterized protein YggE
MKRLILLAVGSLAVALACAVLLRGGAALPDPGPGKPQHTVTALGSATVSGKPDSARVYLGVVTKAETVPAAREENARVVGKVQAAIVALKVPNLKTRTSESRVDIQYAEHDRSRVVGYEVRQSFTVLVKESDPEKLGAIAGRLLDAGLQNGVNYQGDVEFFKADDSELRRQAMSKAVENALANAEAYAAGAKAKVVEVAEITGQDSDYEPTGFIGQGGGFSQRRSGSSLDAGEWHVSSRVHVVCRY